MYLAPQNIPRAVALTLGNKVILYCIVAVIVVDPFYLAPFSALEQTRCAQ